jgi:hypothetical protein
MSNKQVLHQYIDSFIKKNVSKYCSKYGNYLMFFYKESDAVNDKKIKETDPNYRYKIFIYTRDDDYIASYNCWNSFPSDKIDFRPKYE